MKNLKLRKLSCNNFPTTPLLHFLASQAEFEELDPILTDPPINRKQGNGIFEFSLLIDIIKTEPKENR